MYRLKLFEFSPHFTGNKERLLSGFRRSGRWVLRTALPFRARSSFICGVIHPPNPHILNHTSWGCLWNARRARLPEDWNGEEGCLLPTTITPPSHHPTGSNSGLADGRGYERPMSEWVSPVACCGLTRPRNNIFLRLSDRFCWSFSFLTFLQIVSESSDTLRKAPILLILIFSLAPLGSCVRLSQTLWLRATQRASHDPIWTLDYKIKIQLKIVNQVRF